MAMRTNKRQATPEATRSPPISLAPLAFEDALKALVATPPTSGKPNRHAAPAQDEWTQDQSGVACDRAQRLERALIRHFRSMGYRCWRAPEGLWRGVPPALDRGEETDHNAYIHLSFLAVELDE